MKQIIIVFCCGFALLAAFSFVGKGSSYELVYVDVNRLIEGYDRTEIERSKFEDEANDLRSKVDSLIKDWEQELRLYEKEKALMTKKELELKQKNLSNKQQSLTEYRDAIQGEIVSKDQSATQTVVNDINDFVKRYGEKNGHGIIFGAKGDGNIMYADKATDLTELVLKELNAEYNK